MQQSRDPPDIVPLCLVGPTACGKSEVAMAIAEHLPVEIVSVDSAQVYRGLDIGTAKPDAADRQRVPHHLIDLRDPEDSYSAAEFARDARRLVAEIRGRGHLPLLVGGTMLYLLALFDMLDPLPAADPAVRARIESRAAEVGWPALHAQLARQDAATAARLAPNDSQRIQRALEVIELTGQPLSVQRRADWAEGLVTGWPMLSLEPDDRAWLHRRIEARFGAMLERGFVDEVRGLMRRPGVHPGLASMRAVGYRQAWQVLADLGDTGGGSAVEHRLRPVAVAATRQLAKRQLTWLRRLPAREVVACDRQGALGHAVKRAIAHWSGAGAVRPP